MAHAHLKDASAGVLTLAEATDGDMHSMHTIEIDCPPGLPRPKDLIRGVLEDTGLEPDTFDVSTFFGLATWTFSGTTCEQWDKAQEITRPRLRELYAMGTIRYGSW